MSSITCYNFQQTELILLKLKENVKSFTVEIDSRILNLIYLKISRKRQDLHCFESFSL